MIRQLAIFSFILFFFGCTTSEKEQSNSVPDNTYRPSGFHAYIQHGKENLPVSLLQIDSIYHLFYTTGTSEWGHLSSEDLINWTPEVSASLPSVGYGEVVWDEFNTSGLDASWIALIKEDDEVNLSFSRDGKKWEPYKNNPILKTKGKNPSVSWNPDLEQWVLTMVTDNGVSIHTSEDLMNWASQSIIQTDIEADRARLFKLNTQWIMLTMGEEYMYQSGSFDGEIFAGVSPLNSTLGIRAKNGAILNSSDEVILISGNRNSSSKSPSFHTPLKITSADEGALQVSPTQGLLDATVGMVRGKLSKLLTDGPSMFRFRIEEEFELLEIVVSDATTQTIISWNMATETLTLGGSGIKGKEISHQLITPTSPDSLTIDLIIDHTTIDLILNHGDFTTNVEATPDTFFSKVQVFLDGELYDAKGVLYEIGL